MSSCNCSCPAFDFFIREQSDTGTAHNARSSNPGLRGQERGRIAPLCRVLQSSSKRHVSHERAKLTLFFGHKPQRLLNPTIHSVLEDNV